MPIYPAWNVLYTLRYMFAYLLRTHIHNINMCSYKTSVLNPSALVRPQLLYCSSLSLLSDIRSLETMQGRATKFIICDSSLDYKERLMNSNLLPLMMEFEIRDILFLLSVLKQIMHTLTYMTFLLLAVLKPAHPPSLNYVIPNPTTTSKVMIFLIEYPDCGTPYL